MTLEQAFFILRHGSAEGNHKYLEAVKVIEDAYCRQKEEIEILKGWERLLKAESHAPIIKKARAEAVKEFAERLKEKRKAWDADGYWIKYFPLSEVDNLVKEFTEELT